MTALHLAAKEGHGKIVETLLEGKADPCAQNDVSVLKD